MKKIDYERTKFVCSQLVENSAATVITAFTIPQDEDYQISDAWISSTSSTVYPLETKTICGGFGFKEDGRFRGYFTGEDSNCIYSKFRSDSTLQTGTPVYYLNAETEDGSFAGSKWYKMLNDNKSCLAYLAMDGIILFSHRTMVDAFMGYAYALTTHKTEYGRKGEKRWEKKAVLDLTKGLFIPCETPAWLLIRKQNK